MEVLAVIPARYGSTRFPGKPLAEIHGRPMIQWVYERVATCESVNEVMVATDDERIADAVRAFGGEVVMTGGHHQSGTDRIQEAMEKSGSVAELILNVQGDEPAIDTQHLESLIALFVGEVEIGTLVTPFRELSAFRDVNRVKAVLGQDGRALYFSRQAVPYDRQAEEDLQLCHQHIGVYAYKRETLKALSSLPISGLEKKESLEQLRWLENGHDIYAAVVDKAPSGVDTPKDLELMRRLLAK